MVIGLVAASGDMPRVVAQSARLMGHELAVVGLEGMAEAQIVDGAESSTWLNVGKIGGIIKFLKHSGAQKVIIAGKIPKGALYSGAVRPDLKAAAILLTLKDRRDDTIIAAVEQEFTKQGLELLDMREFCGPMLCPLGMLTKGRLSDDEQRDVEFGTRMAKGIGALDIGQSVIVKARAVMAVEAIEGTDECIRRGAALGGPGATVVKVVRPGQNLKFDLPVVGLNTLEVMREGGCRVLALEAGHTIVLDRERFIEVAQQAGIAVLGIDAQ